MNANLNVDEKARAYLESYSDVDDWYAEIDEKLYADFSDMTYFNALINEIVPSMVFDHIGGAVPFLAEGTVNGLSFIYRNRHDKSTLEIYNEDEMLYFVSDIEREFNNLTDGKWLDSFVKLVKLIESNSEMNEFTVKSLI